MGGLGAEVGQRLVLRKRHGGVAVLDLFPRLRDVGPFGERAPDCRIDVGGPADHRLAVRGSSLTLQ